MMKLIGEFTYFPNSGETSSVSQTLAYLESKLGPLATPLNKLRQLLESSRQETITGIKAFKEVDIDNIFANDIFLSSQKWSTKRKN